MNKKILFLLSFILFTPLCTAECVDQDKDRFYADDGFGCEEEDLGLGSKGMEELRCDFATIDVEDPEQPDANKVYNPDIAGKKTIKGNTINPNQIEKMDNGIDENCDSEDGQLGFGGEDKDLGSMIDKIATILGNLVGGISVIIVIWGGIMFATAAGDEERTAKAKKAIIGALIGAIIGFLAPFIVGYVITNFA
ncbi:MAG: pilin [Candidatus Gracilibacteria bacterium]|nr:pilin [Candidatus Gracilibacteria bacterium]